MAIKVIAQRREVKLGKNPGMKFVMRPDLYVPIAEKKVFQEASTHSGISSGVIKAAWDAAGEVIRTWATEGHSIPLPGLGTMRFGVRSKAVEKLEDVKTNLISVRRIIFTPNVELRTLRTRTVAAPTTAQAAAQVATVAIPAVETQAAVMEAMISIRIDYD